MIGAMPAVAVRHERRKGQEKRSKRPSQLYIGGPWLPPTSPSPTPSPNGPHYTDSEDGLPEYYLCGKVSALQIIVGSILVGAIILIVGLVQLVPNAADADHRYILLGSGAALLILGFLLTGVRCFCIHCRTAAVDQRPVTGHHPHMNAATCHSNPQCCGGGGATDDDPVRRGHNQLCVVNCIDAAAALGADRKAGGGDVSQMTSPSELDSLIGKDKESSGDT